MRKKMVAGSQAATDLKIAMIHRLLIIICFIAITSVAPAKSWGKDIRIGVIYPLSGAHQETGAALKSAVAFAANIINGRYNFDLPLAASEGLPNHGGRKLRIIVADHKGDPEIGRTETERLITEEQVNAILGCYNSSVTAKASEVAERKGVPFLSATSTSPGLTERGFEWFFRTTPHDGLFAKNFYQFLEDANAKYNLGASRVALFNENTIWGSGVADAELYYANQFKYDVAIALQYPQNSNNFDTEITLLKGAVPDVVFQASYLADAILSIQTYKRMGFKPRAIIGMNAGFLSSSFIERLGSDAEGLFSREVWAYDLHKAKPVIKSMAGYYRIRTGYTLNGTSARAMTGLFVLADAFNRAARLDSRTIKGALEKTDLPGDRLIMPWKGIRFDPKTHQNVLGQGIIVQVQNKAYHTVWPFDLASRPIVLGR